MLRVSDRIRGRFGARVMVRVTYGNLLMVRVTVRVWGYAKQYGASHVESCPSLGLRLGYGVMLSRTPDTDINPEASLILPRDQASGTIYYYIAIRPYLILPRDRAHL